MNHRSKHKTTRPWWGVLSLVCVLIGVLQGCVCVPVAPPAQAIGGSLTVPSNPFAWQTDAYGNTRWTNSPLLWGATEHEHHDNH